VSVPSGDNMQRWRFLVIRDPKVKQTVGVGLGTRSPRPSTAWRTCFRHKPGALCAQCSTRPKIRPTSSLKRGDAEQEYFTRWHRQGDQHRALAFALLMVAKRQACGQVRLQYAQLRRSHRAVDGLLELSVGTNGRFVGEGQDLRQEDPSKALLRVYPVIGVEYSGPG
jgi:hypothetical protein